LITETATVSRIASTAALMSSPPSLTTIARTETLRCKATLRRACWSTSVRFFVGMITSIVDFMLLSFGFRLAGP
jgi:hypothetical protein